MIHIEDWFFSERRIWFFGIVVVGFYCIGLSLFVFDRFWLSCVDFGVFWLSGKLFVAGETSRVFDYATFFNDLLNVFGSKECALRFDQFHYPPRFLFFTYPFGLLPYSIAFLVWIVVSLALYLAAVYAIIPRSTALILAVSPKFVLLNILLGQNGFLTAALIGLALVFMERRPVISGMFVSALTYKPHFGILLPVALLASRNWRVLSSAAATVAVLCILAVTAFGFEGWAYFIHALANRTSGLGPAAGGELRVHSIFGLVYWVGASTLVSWCAQLIISAIVALGICILWNRQISYDLKAAALCAGSFLVSPYALGYDLSILTIAIAFFIKEALPRGFLPGERTVIFLCWVSVFFITLPLAPVLSAILLMLTARRVVAYGRRNIENLSSLSLAKA
jgi:hypothetical protein